MNSDDFIDKLRSLGLPVFSVETASNILGKPHTYAALYLQRLLKAGKIERIERNKYYLPDADIYTIASRIVPYSYISMYAALEHYALTTQVPKGIEVIAPKYHKALRLKNHDVWFYKAKKSFIYGYVTMANGPIYAEPEKIFIDDLYIHGRLYFSEELEHAIKAKKVDVEKMCTYAIRSGRRSIASLLGHYLEQFGANADRLLPYRSKSYIRLAPGGRLDSKWHVYWR